MDRSDVADALDELQMGRGSVRVDVGVVGVSGDDVICDVGLPGEVRESGREEE